MMNETEVVVDLEEAVGSYLNCLSTSCAAGSKLYKSVGNIINEKFHEIFPTDQERNNKLMKTCFQSLQTQNAFEGYQKALLDCKEKLLEILIDNHTKKQLSSKDGKHRSETSEEQEYAAIALRVAKELYCYHQTVADILKPLLFSDFQEDFENATFTNVDGKDEIVSAWLTVSEANKPLRYGYGLTNQEIGQILSWQHGEDVTESCRKKLNQRINNLLQQYIDRIFSNAVCEVDIPIAFSIYPDELQKVLLNCCSPAEGFAASAQGIPVLKDDIEVMLHRELPRVFLYLNGYCYEKASPGKAFENTTLKLHAVRDAISKLVDSKKIGVTKEQIDLFCLHVLATSSVSISNASSRTATMMAFGKYNLVQIKPALNSEAERHVHINVRDGSIEIAIPSKWSIVEDTSLFSSLCRENTLQQIATVEVQYHAIVNIEEYLVKRIEPTPVAHITQCILRQSPSSQVKKEQGRERSKSIKIRLTKATTKLFQRKPVIKSDSEAAIIANEYAQKTIVHLKNTNCKENTGYSYIDSQDEAQPVPPPRLKRNAKKSKKAKSEAAKKETDRKSQEAKKEDLGWFSSLPKFGIPPVPTLTAVKTQSPSVASFEELQGVIDFLSGSSSGSLAITEKNEKIRLPLQTHKRNNSTTSLKNERKADKVTVDGKVKLCHKKSASFSGKTIEMHEVESKDSKIQSLKRMSKDLDMCTKTKEPATKEDAISKEEISNDSRTSDTVASEKLNTAEQSVLPTNNETSVPNIERTPGDGMDKIDKTVFISSVNLTKNTPVTSSSDTKMNTKESKGKMENIVTVSNVISDETAEVNKSNVSERTMELSKKTDLKHSESRKAEEEQSGKSFPIVNIESMSIKSDIQPELTSQHEVSVSQPGAVALHLSTMDISTKDSVQLRKLSKLDVAKSEPNNIHIIGKECSFYDSDEVGLNTSRPESVSSVDSLTGQLTANIELDNHHVLAIENEISLLQGNKQQTLYEPFNSRLSWPVGFGNKLTSMWSDATLENDKPVATSEKSEKSETEFTLDKQQDFQKLLEGSRFLSGHKSVNENWKDRWYCPTNSFDVLQDIYDSVHEQKPHSIDPWPLQSNLQARGAYPPNSNQHLINRNAPNLQLPPNPMGPYMRQNREQLLAKQQILEQYARSQKQQQLQQRASTLQQQHPTQQSSSNVFSNLRMGNTHPTLDRGLSLPPGLSANDYFMSVQNDRHGSISSRPPGFHQPLTPQRSLASQMPFGYAGMQSRSVSDIRMENQNLLHQERIPRSQFSEQNIFFDQQTEI